MAMKKKSKKPAKKKTVYPLYFQASNPSKEVLAWIEEQLEYRVVYFQSGNPPPGCVPGSPNCNQ